MAANDTALIAPLHMQRNGFHLLAPHGTPIRHMGLADTVVVKEGD